MTTEIRILDSVRECSGLVVLVERDGERKWVRASDLNLTRAEVEQMIGKVR